MSEERFDEETLMAYADGELDPGRAAAVEAAMASDPSIARTVRLFRGTAVAARSAVEAETPPVPAALRASIEQAIARAANPAASPEEGNPAIVPVAQPLSVPVRAAANRPWYALAASAAFVAVAVAGYLAGAQRDGPALPGGVAVVAPGDERRAFDTALNESPSGAEKPIGPGATLAVTASFRDNNGNLCREFRLERNLAGAVAGVACRSGGAWSIAFAATEPGGSGEFRPASGHALLDAFLTERGATAPLTEAEESAALRSPDPSR
jgi:anti-sigma factor RsiW